MRSGSRIFVGLQPTVIASRAPHLLLEQSVMIQKIVDVRRPSNAFSRRASPVNTMLTGLSGSSLQQRLGSPGNQCQTLSGPLPRSNSPGPRAKLSVRRGSCNFITGLRGPNLFQARLDGPRFASRIFFLKKARRLKCVSIELL